MDKYIVSTVARYAFALVLAGLVMIWTAPVWTAPAVVDLAVRAVVTGILIGVCLVGVLAVGYANFRLTSWWRSLPPRWEVPAVVQYSSTHAAGPDAPDLQAVAYDELHSPEPANDWDLAIVRFALVARWGGFGWRSMCRYVGSKEWQRCIRLLTGAGVLRPARGNIPPEWAPGWSFSRFRMEVKHGRLSLPYPAALPPAVVFERARTVTVSDGRTQRSDARPVGW